jgi:hypothetical protein
VGLKLGKFPCDHCGCQSGWTYSIELCQLSSAHCQLLCFTLQPQPSSGKPKDKLNDSLKACNEILKELFSKKHSVSMHFCVQYGWGQMIECERNWGPAVWSCRCWISAWVRSVFVCVVGPKFVPHSVCAEPLCSKLDCKNNYGYVAHI